MKSKSIVAVIAALSFMALPMGPTVSLAGHDMHSHSHGETLSGTNPLISEMLILREFRK